MSIGYMQICCMGMTNGHEYWYVERSQGDLTIECIPGLCLCFAPLFFNGLQQNLQDYEEIHGITKKFA